MNIHFPKAPIKYNSKIPNELIYKKRMTAKSGITYDEYVMFNKNGKVIGLMDTVMEDIRPLVGNEFYPSLNFKKFKSLYIDYIESKQKGTGTKLLDYAQIVSKKQGGKGRFHLIASDRFNRRRPAHIFYRKYGLESPSFSVINDIDSVIKKKATIADIYLIDIPMYFIPKKTKSANNNGLSFVKNILKIFKK